MISELIQYLVSKTTITDYVGSISEPSRIYVARRPQGDAVPAMVIEYTGSEHVRHLTGAAGLAEASIQITSYSTSSLEAEQMGNAVRLVLDGYDSETGAMGSLGTLSVRKVELMSDDLRYNDPVDASDVGIYSLEQDFSLWYSETVPSL